MNFVTLQTYTYPHEMSIVRSLLDSEGIETFVRDEVISQVNPFYANAVGGIKLQVLEKDYAKAMEILVEKGFIQAARERNPGLEEKLSTLLARYGRKSYWIALILIVFIAIFIYYVFQGS